ncbi:MAG: hybrid sensor histidine kinase/response regulator [Calditrichota bacterium]
MTSDSTLESPRRYTILAVDDERANLNLLRRTFRRDYELLQAEDGVSGLELLRHNPVDLIISDQRMPRMTGVEMLAKSRELQPDAMRMILTAYTDVRDIIDAINKGHIYRYILKPWSPEELKLTVDQALEHYRLTAENRELIIRLTQSLTDLKNAQRELIEKERLSAVGRVASSIIHDLKLPMSNIRASASLLGKPNLNQTMRDEFAVMIVKEVDRLVEMTRELLEFSRGETRLALDNYEFETLLEDVCKQVEREFQQTGVKINRKWEKLGPFLGDYNRLRRTLLNLMTNARDAMSRGGVLTINASFQEKELIIRVEDTGTGIPEKILPTLFEPFVTFGKHDGTGLGLSIAKRIVEAHHGFITAANKPHHGGAVMEIHLPLESYE